MIPQKKPKKLGPNAARLNTVMTKELLLKWKEHCREHDHSSSGEIRRFIKEAIQTGK